MPLAPITEEDKPAVETMVKKLVRFRRREHSQGKKYTYELDNAIKALLEYGALKGWWDDPDMDKW